MSNLPASLEITTFTYVDGPDAVEHDVLKVFRVTKDNIDDVRQMIADLGYNFGETFENKSHPSEFIAYGVDSLGRENIADGMIGELLAINLIGAVYAVEEDLLFSMIDPIRVEGPLSTSRFAF